MVNGYTLPTVPDPKRKRGRPSKAATDRHTTVGFSMHRTTHAELREIAAGQGVTQARALADAVTAAHKRTRAPNDADIDTDLVLAQARALVDGERDGIANAANLAALLFGELGAVNWAGFYFVHGDELVLGPFAGKPACTRIARGRGVCGSAWAQARTLVVPDVHAFPGHIACDGASRSETVVPLVRDGAIFGVLDVDSPQADRFDEAAVALLDAIAALYVAASDALVRT